MIFDVNSWVSFVPAQSAQLPIIDQLFTIFTTDESMAQVINIKL
jgi:DNA mismatch repair ATPase MutS